MSIFNLFKYKEEAYKKEIAELKKCMENLKQEKAIIDAELTQKRRELDSIKIKMEEYQYYCDKYETKAKEVEKTILLNTEEIKCLPSSRMIYDLCSDKDKRHLIALDDGDMLILKLYNSLSKKNYELNSQNEETIKLLELNQKKLEELKTDIDGYLKTYYSEMRSKVVHDLYQRATSCEYEALRSLRENVENESLSILKWQLKTEKHIYDTENLTSSYILDKLCDEFLQLNITKLVKEMKYSDWNTIETKIAIVFETIESSLLHTGHRINKNILKYLYRYMEAKYLVIQKQEIQKEKEREEREAQKEYDRAIKKALKDEEKALETLERKKRELAEEKTQAKISKLLEQIKGLEKALTDAKALRERAMSMAQQTKSGYIYIISNIGSFGKDVYKIGMTRRLDPMERVLELSNASVPFPFDVHAFIYCEDAPSLEAELHKVFDDKKINSINYRKEYFHVSLDEIKSVLKTKGIEADFIDEPDAFQYRESLIKQKNMSLAWIDMNRVLND